MCSVILLLKVFLSKSHALDYFRKAVIRLIAVAANYQMPKVYILETGNP